MELKIYNPSEDGFLKNIEWNFDELKQEIKQAVEPYKGLVLTDEQIPEGKRTVANLRKFVAAFETERKRIKAQCMEPYEKFKQQYDELLVDVNDAIKGIDIQIKESEKNKKAEKLSRVKEIYQEVVPEGLQNILRFDKLDTNRFCLASTTLKSVKEEIQSLLSRTYSDISVIQKAGGYTFEMMECYKETLDLNTAIRKGQLEYDSLRECVTSTVIGDYIYNYFDNVTSVAQRIDKAITSDGMVIGEQIKGIIDGIRAMMRTQANNAHPSPVRSMIFEDLVEGSPTYGALCLGTMGFQIANKRTADGKEWDWRTFGTGAGFFADLIVAGTMLADRIRAGKLQSQDYVEDVSGFELNLDTGVITFYGSDDYGNASKLVFEKGGITITNLATGSVGKVSIRYQKVGDSYFPIISGTDGEQGYSMNQNSLIYMMGTLIKASMGITGGKGYVNTDTLNVRESIMSGNRKGISQVVKYAGGQAEFVNGICVSGMDGTSGLSGRAEFSDGSYMQFENGLFVGGYTTEGGGIS